MGTLLIPIFMYSKKTRKINITVNPYFLDEQSEPEDQHFVWAYQVTIDNQSNEKVQLKNRYWKIIDSNGSEQDEMSLYNFKLAGLISGKDNSYISLVNAGGEVLTVTLGQFLGKIKLVDLRITEAIFEKEDKSFVIIDFNNVIREANEY